MTISSFENYGLSDEMLKAIGLLSFEHPTKVQEQVIPAVLQKKDIIVKSRTGSGKTAAFAIPICEMIDWDENRPQSLVVTPTRELAIQIKEDIFNLGRFKRIKVSAIYGKAPFAGQEKELRQKTHIVVGTPGRIIDHMERGTFDTSGIKYLVIDEADEMLNMGFIGQIESIINNLPVSRETILLSATMPGDIENLCSKYMVNPAHIEIEEQNQAADRIHQEIYSVDERGKNKLLKDIIVVENPDSCIVFCNTKQMVDNVYNNLLKLRYTCRKIHGGMEQIDRLKVMDDFKKGRFRYLIATDVAARGIDIDNISLVINYDIPQDGETYVHRIGRTGRIGREGRAITFVAKNEARFLNIIQQYTGTEIPMGERPGKETVENSMAKFSEKVTTRPEDREAKGESLNREIMKLHINAGRKTKMRPADVVGAICSIEGISAGDIGIIDIEDISTFVEILNNKGGLVYNELQGKPIKGRLRRVSKVEM